MWDEDNCLSKKRGPEDRGNMSFAQRHLFLSLEDSWQLFENGVCVCVLPVLPKQTYDFIITLHHCAPLNKHLLVSPGGEDRLRGSTLLSITRPGQSDSYKSDSSWQLMKMGLKAPIHC